MAYDELTLIKEGHGELGRHRVVPEMEDHPIWVELRKLSFPSSSTILIDNTTLKNALFVMREGLGDEGSFRAALLPDLTVVFFALTHFEKILVLDHGAIKQETEEVGAIFSDVIELFSWENYVRGDGALQNILYGTFNSIQAEFQKRTAQHEAWSKSWKALLGAGDLRPLYFSQGVLDQLIDSPSQPLHPDALGLDGNWLTAINGNDEDLWDSRWPLLMRRLTRDERLSAIASYHTFRAIFYHSLAEFLGSTYLPCGMRGIETNFISVEALDSNSDYLSSKLPISFPLLNLVQGAAKAAYSKFPPLVQLPILRVTPSLAKVIDKLKGFKRPNWPLIASELRGESQEYRDHMRQFMIASQEDTFDSRKVLEIAQAVAREGTSGWEAAASAVKISGSLAESYLTNNPTKAIPAIQEVAQKKPWQFLDGWLQRRKLKFLLHARDLAAETVALERECATVWGRGFSAAERSYLSVLQSVSPYHGI